jgi:osmotically-inducible protein OsmY
MSLADLLRNTHSAARCPHVAASTLVVARIHLIIASTLIQINVLFRRRSSNSPQAGGWASGVEGGFAIMSDSDRQLQQRVQEGLEWDPSVDAAHIGVAANNGVVTLSGHVTSYAEKLATEQAVRRIRGVKAIAQEIEVRLPFEPKTSDEEIAQRAVRILAWDVSIPKDAVTVKVEKGRVALAGEVKWQHQRTAAEHAVQKLTGVREVINQVRVRARPQATDIRHRIEEALRRDANLEAARITVTVVDGQVELGGSVQHWHERDAAERAAWSAPGVSSVRDHIAIL